MNAEKITSAHNPLIKKLVQLSNKQSARTKSNLTILDGVHLTREYLTKIGKPELCVVSEGVRSAEVAEILVDCNSRIVRVVEIPKSLFVKISPVIEGIGILFVIKIPKRVTKVNPLAETLILENIQDPGNLGAILRSAAAFGVEQIICSNGTVSAWSPKVLRAGMGAHFELEIFEKCDLEKAILQLKIPVFATSLEADKSIYDENLNEPKVWIFGNEGAGVSEDIQKLATKKVKIPHSVKIESLNVAMAATVCLSESWRQKYKLK